LVSLVVPPTGSGEMQRYDYPSRIVRLQVLSGGEGRLLVGEKHGHSPSEVGLCFGIIA
jgi:hypothetical protein